MKQLFSNPNQLLIALGLIVLVVLTRTVFHIAPNFEFLTAATIVAAVHLRKSYSVLVPALSIVISDFLIGNSSIFIFTWSGFAVAYFIGLVLRKYRVAHHLFGFQMAAIVSVLFFYFWTNFGVMVLSPLYPLSFQGYILSLTMALPFLKMQLISAVLVTSLLCLLANTHKLVSKRFNFRY